MMRRADGCTCGYSTAPADGSHRPGCPVAVFDRPSIDAPAPSLADALGRLEAWVDALAARTGHRHSITLERGVWHGAGDPPPDHDPTLWRVDVDAEEGDVVGVVWDMPGEGPTLIDALLDALMEVDHG